MSYSPTTIIVTTLVFATQVTSKQFRYSELLEGKSNHLVITPSPADYWLSAATQLLLLTHCFQSTSYSSHYQKYPWLAILYLIFNSKAPCSP